MEGKLLGDVTYDLGNRRGAILSPNFIQKQIGMDGLGTKDGKFY